MAFGSLAHSLPDTLPGALPDSLPDSLGANRAVGWPAPDASTGMRRPPLADRQCSRSGCSEGASVTLTFHYGQSQVWLDNLAPVRDPHAYDMCARHAARLSVPHGWHLDDRRQGRHGALSAV